MNVLKNKILKQLGIHELIPFKTNIKLFRHMVVSKYIFLYFFYRSFVASKYIKIKNRMKQYFFPFSEVRDDVKYLYKLNLKKKVKLPSKNFLMNKKKNLKVMDINKLTKRGDKELNVKYSKNIGMPIFFRDSERKVPKSFKYFNHDILKSYMSLVPSLRPSFNEGNMTAESNPLYEYILAAQKLYLKLSFINLDQMDFNFISHKKFKIANTVLKSKLQIYKKLLVNLIKFYNKQLFLLYPSPNHECIIYHKKYNCYIILNDLIQKLFKVWNKIIHHALKSKKIKLLFYYDNLTVKNKFRRTVLRFKKKWLKHYSSNNYDDYAWFQLLDFLFPKFVRSGYTMFLKKDFFKKYMLNPILYDKYIKQLKKADMLYNYTEEVMSYKQKKNVKKYFIQLYRQKYRTKKKGLKPPNLSSYYKKYYTILCHVMGIKHKKLRFYYKPNRIQSFNIKLIKVLFGFKRTKKCMPLLKNNFMLKINQLNNNPIDWLYNLKNLITTDFNNVKNVNTSIIRSSTKILDVNTTPILGDKLQINFKAKTHDISLIKVIRYTYTKLIHCYINLINMLEEQDLKAFKGLNSYSFFLDTIKYKLGYILAKYLWVYEKKINNVKIYKINNILPIFINDKYLYLATKSHVFHFEDNFIYTGQPFDINKENLDRFYRYRLNLLISGQDKNTVKEPEDKKLTFLNYFYKLPQKTRLSHNRYHINRYLFIVQGIKSFIGIDLENRVIYGKHSIYILKNLTSSNYVINEFKNKIHKNNVEKLLLGYENKLKVTT